MQQKLFDDNRQLVLPAELMDYTPDFLKESEADELLTLLLQNTPWQQTKVKMYDKEVLTPRLTAWYGDRPLRADDQREPIPWIPELRVICGFVDAKGWETNVKLGYDDFKLFIGYTFTGAQSDENGRKRPNPLTAKHRLNNILMYTSSKA